MSKDEWFRQVTWSELIAANFDERLQQARPHNRSQYLRIQAVHLAGTGRVENIRVALGLLDRFVESFGEDLLLPMAHKQRADCYSGLGEIETAVQCYRQALDAERTRPNVSSGAALDFCWLVVQERQTGFYNECESVLVEFEEGWPFPVQRYMYHGVRAIIANHRGDREVARVEATRALEFASTKRSGFRFHQLLGLVKNESDEIRNRLMSLAAG